MDADQIVAEYRRDVADLAAQAKEAKEQIQRLTGAATSADGAVTVTVNGGGALRSLSFGPRADQLSTNTRRTISRWATR